MANVEKLRAVHTRSLQQLERELRKSEGLRRRDERRQLKAYVRLRREINNTLPKESGFFSRIKRWF